MSELTIDVRSDWVKHPFNPDEPACVRCGKAMYLLESHEWDDDERLNLCSNCSSEIITALWAEREQITKRLGGQYAIGALPIYFSSALDALQDEQAELELKVEQLTIEQAVRILNEVFETCWKPSANTNYVREGTDTMHVRYVRAIAQGILAASRIAELERELDQYQREGIESAFPRLMVTISDKTAEIEQLELKLSVLEPDLAQLTADNNQQAIRLSEMEVEIERLGDELLGQQKALIEARKEVKVLQIKSNNSLANNLCADHRDKQQGKSCLACEVEQLRAENDTLKRLSIATVEDAERQEKLVAELRAERDSAQKRFEASSALAAERGCQISEMQETLAALRSAAEWQPTTTPPTDTCWVLVYADGAMATRAWNHNRRRWENWEECQAAGVVMDAITHWMPLPEPPAALGEQRKTGKKRLVFNKETKRIEAIPDDGTSIIPEEPTGPF